jgi:hypothetical protein
MKTNSKTLFQSVLLLIVLFITTCARAQFAPTTTVMESSCATGRVYSNNTGNDILSFMGNEYTVTVTDDRIGTTYGTNAGISMSINGGTPYHSSFTVQQNVEDPDVAFVEVKGNVYAVATYFVCGKYYFVETFTISGGSLISCGLASFGWSTNSGFFGTTVNIDADSQGNFAITYDDTSGNLRAVTGAVSSSGTIALNNPSAPEVYLVTTSVKSQYPDVAMIEYQSTTFVDFTWVDSITGELKVMYGSLDSLSIGSGLLYPFGITSLNPFLGLKYYYPRIACPNKNNVSASDEWTVVVEETNGNDTNRIDGFNFLAGNLTTAIYNDGGVNSPADLTAYPNTRPVVCYDSISNNVWVGWNFNNSLGSFSGPAITNGLFPIVLKCDPLAQNNPISPYLPVPRTLNTGDIDNYLSIAGRNSTNNLYSFYSLRNTDDYFKVVSQTAATLRHVAPAKNSFESFIQAAQSTLHEYDISTSGNACLFVYDLTGKEVFATTMHTIQNTEILQEFAINHPSAIYLIRIIKENGAVLYSDKVYIGK